jgi:hypothetical protein
MLVRYAPDYLFEPQPEVVAAGMRRTYRGHAGIREAATDLREAWERIDYTPLEIFDAGDVCVVLGHFRLRARGSGIEFDYPVGSVYWPDGRGLVACQREFSGWDEALRAAGIAAAAVGTGPPPRATSTP